MIQAYVLPNYDVITLCSTCAAEVRNENDGYLIPIGDPAPGEHQQCQGRCKQQRQQIRAELAEQGEEARAIV